MAAVLIADEGLAGARAVAMQGTRDELLPGTGLAGDEDGRVRLRQAPDGAEDLLHRRRLPRISGVSPPSGGASTRRRLSSSARRTSSTALSTSKGLGRYSKAPPWKAATALSRSE